MRHIALIKSDAKYLVKDAIALAQGRSQPRIASRVPVRTIKRLIANSDLALMDGSASWFYTAYSRGDTDPLTNYTLDWIMQKLPKRASILNTGCGTGIILFWLIDQGFAVEGFDFLDGCVDIANKVKQLGNYTTRIWQDDGFAPERIDRKYDLITAMHWVFSAWAGNYGNQRISDAKNPDTREQLLTAFLSQYKPHLNAGGYLILELTDAIGDYRVPNDHPYLKKIPLDSIYPVRHSPDQVSRCASAAGLAIVQYKSCTTYSHHPRTSYIFQNGTAGAE
jgi:SAM-dependent methyltransferase